MIIRREPTTATRSTTSTTTETPTAVATPPDVVDAEDDVSVEKIHEMYVFIVKDLKRLLFVSSSTL